MLLQFNFSNFVPLKDGASLNLEATSYSEYKEHIRKIGNKKFCQLGLFSGQTQVENHSFIKHSIICVTWFALR